MEDHLPAFRIPVEFPIATGKVDEAVPTFDLDDFLSIPTTLGCVEASEDSGTLDGMDIFSIDTVLSSEPGLPSSWLDKLVNVRAADFGESCSVSLR